MSNFEVGEIVEFYVPNRNVTGNGTLVKILEISESWATVSTGCGEWPEKLTNLRKLP